MVLINVETTATGALHEAESPKWLLAYLTRKTGLLTSNIGEAGAFFHTRSGDAAPDMQYFCAPGYFYDHGFRTYATPALGIGCSLVGAGKHGPRPAAQQRPEGKGGHHRQLPQRARGHAGDDHRGRASPGDLRRSAAFRGLAGREIHPGGRTSSREALAKIIRREVEHTTPGLHRPDRHRVQRSGRPATAGARRAATASRRRVGVPHRPARQHPRPDRDGRRKSRHHDRRRRLNRSRSCTGTSATKRHTLHRAGQARGKTRGSQGGQMAAGADETGAADRAVGPGQGDRLRRTGDADHRLVAVHRLGAPARPLRADRRPLPLVRTRRRARRPHRDTAIRADARPCSPRRKAPPPASCRTPIPGSATA